MSGKMLQWAHKRLLYVAFSAPGREVCTITNRIVFQSHAILGWAVEQGTCIRPSLKSLQLTPEWRFAFGEVRHG